MTSKLLFLLLVTSICGACATPKPPQPEPLPPIIQVKTIFLYPAVSPEHLLPCPPEPAVVNPDTATSEERDAWGEQVRLAGGTCRGEAKWWQDYAKTWPR